jgi:hypothetical protein
LTPALCGNQSAAEEARELAPDQGVEPCASATSFRSEHALVGGAMFEKAWGSTVVPGAAVACGGHALLIDFQAAEVDPWRE